MTAYAVPTTLLLLSLCLMPSSVAPAEEVPLCLTLMWPPVDAARVPIAISLQYCEHPTQANYGDHTVSLPIDSRKLCPTVNEFCQPFKVRDILP